MGKRGPKKGVPYSKDSLLYEVRIMLYRRNNPQASWADTTRFVHKDLVGKRRIDFKDNQLKEVKRRYKKFEKVFYELQPAIAKMWEKVCNGGQITEQVWKILPLLDGKDHFRIVFKKSDWWYVFPYVDLERKINDIRCFYQDGAIAGWMTENDNIDEGKLLLARKKWDQEELMREELLALRGEEHLVIVAISKETAELATKDEVFELLNERERDAIEMITASMNKDKSNP